jgi:hypothetical protein
MLGMAFFKSLVKQHGTQYFEPIGKALAAAGIKEPSPFNPYHAWVLKDALLPYGLWLAGQYLPKSGGSLPEKMPPELRDHAEFAIEQLQASPLEISGTMRRHQLKLADRQCRMSELSSSVQQLVIMLATTLYAADQEDDLVRTAADVLCHDLTRQITGRKPTDKYYRTVTTLGEKIADGGFQSIAGIDAGEILMRYEQ